jgi:hypothetical protein
LKELSVYSLLKQYVKNRQRKTPPKTSTRFERGWGFPAFSTFEL